MFTANSEISDNTCAILSKSFQTNKYIWQFKWIWIIHSFLELWTFRKFRSKTAREGWTAFETAKKLRLRHEKSHSNRTCLWRHQTDVDVIQRRKFTCSSRASLSSSSASCSQRHSRSSNDDRKVALCSHCLLFILLTRFAVPLTNESHKFQDILSFISLQVQKSATVNTV